jgi:hypothetical protein
MKKVLLGLILLAPLPALAQETYSIPATAAQAARVERQRVRQNAMTCKRFNLAPTCTQAQACVAAGAAGGAACTALQARATTPSSEMFPATLAGRESMIIFAIVVPHFNDFLTQDIADDSAAYCIWWKDAATTRAAKDIDCNKTTPPRGNNCELCK